ncbi:alpha/beta fold hydrolase [Salsipaludibacter albus]|uniref:alpha/beta fold hydrolase n=1 Tax=Salsipaludibacter albus TaxID=2849650 RepID=UPI001EE3B7FA|nr:alpha/beta hydrolase [Salsipaludibacter albus]MBY5161748.1 alpha/beta hydrolase [Salsipaludibacter albus]
MTDVAWDVVGDGPPVVLVPAGIGSRRQFDRVATDLGRDFTVITMDPRGQGESPNPVGDYFDHEDALDVLQEAGFDHAGWVGCSNGGRIVADVAATTPTAVDAMVLLGPALPGGGSWDDFPDDFGRLQEADRACQEGDFDLTAEIHAELFVVGRDRTLTDLPQPLASGVMGLLMAAAAREQGAWDGGEPREIDPPLRDRLATIEAPTLVGVGTHDHPAIHHAARRYREELPNAVGQAIQGVAHFPAWEAPAVTAELVRDHLLAPLDPDRPRG